MQLKNKILFFVLLAISLLMTGCATTTITRDSEVTSLTMLMDEDMDSKDIVSKQGLTETGCSMLFPGMDPSQCHTEWHTLSIDEKISYIQENSSPAIRLFWESARRKALQENCEWVNIDTSSEKFNQCLNEDPYEAVHACANKPGQNEDNCILTHAEIATDKEMNANGEYIPYAKELASEARRQKIAQLR